MKTVQVELGDRSYPIRIAADTAPCSALSEPSGVRVLIVSDSNVDVLYGDWCEEVLQQLDMKTSRAVVPAGEASKNLAQTEALYTEALTAGLDRSSLIVALGGGMVGDLAGFVAATFLRGIRFVQVPTTLLAMVDSSVGGKTGVNLEQGKNLVGAFHQPVEVDANLSTLKTLPDREYRSGLAEIVKYGVIWDAVLFQQIEKHADSLLKRDETMLEEVVARCCEIKAEVVAIDEKESGLRAILNFGHTLGHAVEARAGYGALLHGEAVSLGMVYAAVLSSKHRGFSGDDKDRIVQLLGSLGLPVACSDVSCRIGWQDVWEAMLADKKSRRRNPRFVLCERLGAVIFGCEVSERDLRETYEKSLAQEAG